MHVVQDAEGNFVASAPSSLLLSLDSLAFTAQLGMPQPGLYRALLTPNLVAQVSKKFFADASSVHTSSPVSCLRKIMAGAGHTVAVMKI